MYAPLHNDWFSDDASSPTFVIPLTSDVMMERLCLARGLCVDGTDMLIKAPDWTSHRHSTYPVLAVMTTDAHRGKSYPVMFYIINSGETAAMTTRLLAWCFEARASMIREAPIGKGDWPDSAAGFVRRHGLCPGGPPCGVFSPLQEDFEAIKTDGARGFTAGWRAHTQWRDGLRPHKATALYVSCFRDALGVRLRIDLSRRMCVFHVMQATGR